MLPTRVLSQRRVAPLLLALASLAVPTPVPGHAAETVATRVADIGQGVPVLNSDAFLPPLPGPVELDGVLYFQNDDGIHGRELWRSDGTAEGTRMVLDVCPGACGSVSISSYLSTAATSTAVFFAADDGVHGQELWTTDGSAEGTRMVRDLLPGWRSSRPGFFVATTARLFFWAQDAELDRQLWTSDGTFAGTLPVPAATPIWRGAGAALGDLLLFAGQMPNGLWRSDGTAAGTSVLSSVAGPSQSHTANAQFLTFAGHLLFASSSSGAATLWVSDGTAGGTHELAPAGNPRGFALVGDRLYFFAETSWDHWSLWSVDGALQVQEEAALPAGSNPARFYGRAAAFDGELYFTAYDAGHGEELWRFRDGTPELFFDVNPGPASGFPFGGEDAWSGNGAFLAELPDRLLFFADDGIHGLELWATDGSTAGTGLIADLTPGPERTRLEFFQSLLPPTVLDGRLLFRTRSFTDGIDLWSSDGTPEGTHRVRALREARSAFSPPQPGAAIYGPGPIACFAPVGDGLLFAADDGTHGLEPWHAPAGAGGAHLVADLANDELWSSPQICAAIGGRGVFTAEVVDPSFEVRLLSTSGQTGDVVDLGGPLIGLAAASAYFDDRLLLGSDELWSTDGSPSGTEDLEPFGAGYLEQLLPLDARLLAAGWQLKVTDGSPGGLTAIEPPGLEASLSSARLTRLGPFALFFGWQPATGQELWRTDGTPEGTTLVRDIRPGPASALLEEYGAFDRPALTRMVPLGARAFFAADDGAHGEELWVSDGSAAGTALFADLAPGPYPSVPRELARVGDWIFFSAESPAAGRELWATQGGAGRVTLLFDLVSGADSSVPQELTAIGSDLYFSAWTPRAGREPWRVRVGPGGPSTPTRIADLAPGPRSSSPLLFRNVGADVFTVANDNVHGFELWTLRDPDVLFADDFESSGVALWAAVAP